MSNTLKNLYGRTADSPCRPTELVQGILGGGCDRSDYEAWYDVAVTVRQAFDLWVAKGGKPTIGALAWRAVWDSVKAPSDLGITDADDLDISDFELVFRERIESLSSWAEWGNRYLLKVGFDTPELEVVRAREEEKTGLEELGDTATTVLWLVGGTIAAGALGWLFLGRGR